MIIHVVQQGETANSIAEEYNISVERFVLENQITNPNRLAIGETLVILYPEITHTVQVGDTLSKIAYDYDVTVMQLLRNNPNLSNREFIYPGEIIVISYEGDKIMKISTNGYAYPFINRDVLRKTLPYLTYLTIYSYTFTSDGEIIDINDAEIIQLAEEYGVAPVAMLTAAASDQLEEINVTHELLMSQERQEQFINNVLNMLRGKGYYGVNINTSYIFPEDRVIYVDFIANFANRIKSEGYKVFNTLSLSAFEIMTGTIYEGFDYSRLGQVVDGILLMTFEWGNFIGIPTGIIAFNTIRNFLEYMSRQIPPEKIFVGVPIIGYVWKLPFVAGTSRGLTINYNAAVELASDVGSVIQYDDITKSSYFQYILIEEYIVRFRDARSVDDYVKLVPEFDFNGTGIWNIAVYFPQMWLVINSQYDIEKII